MVSLIRARDAVLRPDAIRATLLLLLLVGAVVAGLLAMHTISSSGMSGHDAPAASGMVMADPGHHASETMGHEQAAPAVLDASGAGDPGHAMSTIACVLALLFSALLLVARHARTTSKMLPRPGAAPGRIVAFAAVKVNPPPNLDALSISRT